jgi:predicted nucleic acid-binding protein
MNEPILVDTDVMVDFLQGAESAVELINSHSTSVMLSSLTVAELHACVRGQAESDILERLLSLFEIVPVSADVAAEAGRLKRDYEKGSGIGLSHAIIAVTAMSQRAELKTRQVHRYPMIENLVAAY